MSVSFVPAVGRTPVLTGSCTNPFVNSKRRALAWENGQVHPRSFIILAIAMWCTDYSVLDRR